jgi:MA3 domain
LSHFGISLYQLGWVQRRKTEAAKSIADLHKEVEKEEEAAKTSRRSSINSQPTLRRASSLAVAAAPTIDEDGFMQIQRGSMKKTSGSNKNSSPPSILPVKPKTQILRRASSQPVGMNYLNSDSANDLTTKASATPSLPSIMSLPHHELEVPSPQECADKMKKILKEYFVGGDMANAVLSIHELVNVGTDGSIDRGAEMITAGILMVMEMKEGDVKKFLSVLDSCLKQSKIESQAVVQGLNEPLEFLNDIEIDAPLAGGLLALIISELMKWNIIELEFLLSAPEPFRMEGKPSAFGRKVLEKRGGDPTDVELLVLDKLKINEGNI